MAYIAPNTHAQLESFYAVPQIGAVLVPINYRLTADDFVYIIDHCGRERRLRPRGLSRRVDRIRDRCRRSGISSRSKAQAKGWLDYEALLADASAPVRAGRRSKNTTS